ncbi:unnamed protein product [Cylindrotheca closterium]|uniref:Integrase catalytic domain-containing protein n=1 Tax=Cylindrotheca closterium TaxID=2856 RepID=A0AAD2CEI3_9STRA|nr:unnamed protein product [Cylindrotheca closterium]
MAKQGIIPRRLASVHPPTCSSCLFAKATRQQSRHKHWTEKTVVKTPGQVVSVDQLISPTPGLVAQMTGILTKKRYTCATIYVDQCSGLGFVYLQKSTSADETIMGKTAFEAYAKQHGATIKAYHADNGVFCANKWVDECRRLEQTLTFAGVNAHHSNGLAEQRIRMANDAINEAPNLRDEKGRSPLQLFSQTDIQTHNKHWIPLGCPAYVLDPKLGQGFLNKWEARSRVGIYLGRSPNHGRNVALVLNQLTGLVLPQFHVTIDKGFNTVKQDKYDTHWQMRAGLQVPKKGAMPPSN